MSVEVRCEFCGDEITEADALFVAGYGFICGGCLEEVESFQTEFDDAGSDAPTPMEVVADARLSS